MESGSLVCFLHCSEGTVSADSSWKVRRAAVGVLSAFIRVRSDILKEYYKEVNLRHSFRFCLKPLVAFLRALGSGLLPCSLCPVPCFVLQLADTLVERFKERDSSVKVNHQLLLLCPLCFAEHSSFPTLFRGTLMFFWVLVMLCL